MGALSIIFITLSLNVFYIHTAMGSPVADPAPGVNVNVDVKINEPGGSEPKPEPEPEPEDCNKDCKYWCYPSENWPYTCSDFCAGESQSPIDICSESPKTETGSITFSASYSEAIDKVTIKNNGHAVGVAIGVAIEEGNLPPALTISGGGLTGDYTLAQFHFHWGCENRRGSEHAVDGTRYAMELHLVHYKTSYGSLGDALKYSDGLAVLGVFFSVNETENADLQPLTDNFYKVTEPGTEAEIDFGVALIDLIPTTRTFYRYQGSLTTPTCNEVVIWTVFSQELSFSQKQIDSFRKLKDSHHHQLCDNYRGIQPLNGREVKKFQ